MPNLPLNKLQVFPVRYPSGTIQSNLRTKPRPRGCSGNCPILITFQNDFDARRGNAIHAAIDIFGAFDLEIIATTNGIIPATWSVFTRDRNNQRIRLDVPGSGNNPRGGNYVMIRDPNGYFHYYAHLNATPAVQPGQSIRAGQLLGYLGDSGRARTTCQHLHYQVSTRNHGIRFFNPFQELVRLATALGATPSQGNIRIPISASRPVQSKSLGNYLYGYVYY